MTTGQEFYTSLRDMKHNSRGRKNSMRAVCPEASIMRAAHLIDLAGADRLITKALAEDHPNRARGVGRPSKIPPRAFLVMTLGCNLAGLSADYTRVHLALTSDISRAGRRALGLAVSADDAEDALLEKARKAIGYTSVTRLAARIAACLDPRPFPTQRGLTKAEIAEIEKGFDPEVQNRKQARADEFQATILRACIDVMPAELRDRWTGDVTVDGTVIPMHGKFGHHSHSRLIEGSQSPEVNAGLHAKDRDKRDTANMDEVGRKNRGDSKQYTFGMEAHVAVMTSDPDAPRFPRLITGVSLDRPGTKIGPNVVTLLRHMAEAGLPIGRVTMDLGISQLAIENLHLPLRALGYDIVMMYRSTETGLQLTHKSGLLCVDGNIYGPCLPKDLRDAKPDLDAKRIDQATFDARIEARRVYAARVKTAKDGTRTYVWRCPGCGPHRTVDCDLKPVPASAQRGNRKALPLIMTQPEALPPVCANSQSVSVEATWAVRYLQRTPAYTPEWHRYYSHTRNLVEAKNRTVKNRFDGDVTNTDVRRFRGYGKQFLSILFTAVAANVHTLAHWLDNEDKGLNDPPRNVGGRPRNPSLDEYGPKPSGPPLRIIGPVPPGKPKKPRRAA